MIIILVSLHLRTYAMKCLVSQILPFLPFEEGDRAYLLGLSFVRNQNIMFAIFFSNLKSLCAAGLL